MAVGPLARSVDDLWAVLQVLAGPDGVDPHCTRTLMPGSLDDVDWSEVDVYAVPTNGTVRPVPEVEAAVHKSALALEQRGARLRVWTGPDLSRAFELWAAAMAATGETYADLVVAPTEPSLLRQIARWPLGRSDHAGGVLAMLMLERTVGRWLGTADRAEEARRLRAAFDQAVGPRGIVIHPVYPRTAPRHRAIALRDPRDVGCTMLFNVTESPVTVVRVDTDRRGLPIGVQLAGARGSDRLTLAAGKALERVFGVPAPVDPAG
jgi:fatty acid amide hydrolase 2